MKVLHKCSRRRPLGLHLTLNTRKVLKLQLRSGPCLPSPLCDCDSLSSSGSIQRKLLKTGFLSESAVQLCLDL